ncbi:hypothetical protein K435DRAFT_69069 [Dendrothele bispora CBS 962.96]|uniref:Uncharacterized protein n=1 Tax=Dendrothele bispora (strain CBS 962.96) TaxID=1314807 RepID=A0A4S8M4U8_DENBC|nr:hypothetical protein K435DRAFT_69069 [Dendrothele bispora CBS 962.96]
MSSFFSGAHDLQFKESNINNIQGNKYETNNNDNRKITGSYNTYNTNNTNSHNTNWNNRDERNDNRHYNNLQHSQTANFGDGPERYRPTRNEWDRSDIGDPERYRSTRDEWDRTSQVGYDSEYSWHNGGDSIGQPAYGPRPRHIQTPSYGYYDGYSSYVPPRSYRGPAPPHPPASAPPAPVESAEAYRARNRNPYIYVDPYHSSNPAEPEPMNRNPYSQNYGDPYYPSHSVQPEPRHYQRAPFSDQGHNNLPLPRSRSASNNPFASYRSEGSSTTAADPPITSENKDDAAMEVDSEGKPPPSWTY